MRTNNLLFWFMCRTADRLKIVCLKGPFKEAFAGQDARFRMWFFKRITLKKKYPEYTFDLSMLAKCIYFSFSINFHWPKSTFIKWLSLGRSWGWPHAASIFLLKNQNPWTCLRNKGLVHFQLIIALKAKQYLPRPSYQLKCVHQQEWESKLNHFTAQNWHLFIYFTSKVRILCWTVA